jgi:hypothetical protein
MRARPGGAGGIKEGGKRGRRIEGCAMDLRAVVCR